MTDLTPLVALLGALVTVLMFGGIVMGYALWRLAQRMPPLEATVIQTANVLNEHLGAQRVVPPPGAGLPNEFIPADQAELEAFFRNWSGGEARPWEDS